MRERIHSLAPVIGQQRIVGRQVTSVRLLQAFGHSAVQLPPLRIEEQAVGDLLGDDVFERVGQLWLR